MTGGAEEGDWRTARLWVDPEQIGLVVAILEGYENHFLVRTERRGEGYLRIWHPASYGELLGRVLVELGQEITVERLETEVGMTRVDEIFPP